MKYLIIAFMILLSGCTSAELVRSGETTIVDNIEEVRKETFYRESGTVEKVIETETKQTTTTNEKSEEETTEQKKSIMPYVLIFILGLVAGIAGIVVIWIKFK